MTKNRKISRRECREIAFQILFAYDFQKEYSPEEYYSIHTENEVAEDNEFVKDLFLGAVLSCEETDHLIEETSIKWKISRMSAATRCILRLSVYEMLKTDIPTRVAINEAVEIIKKYDDETAPTFVNGILNKIARNHNLISEE